MTGRESLFPARVVRFRTGTKAHLVSPTGDEWHSPFLTRCGLVIGIYDATRTVNTPPANLCDRCISEAAA